MPEGELSRQALDCKEAPLALPTISLSCQVSVEVKTLVVAAASLSPFPVQKCQRKGWTAAAPILSQIVLNEQKMAERNGLAWWTVGWKEAEGTAPSLSVGLIAQPAPPFRGLVFWVRQWQFPCTLNLLLIFVLKKYHNSIHSMAKCLKKSALFNHSYSLSSTLTSLIAVPLILNTVPYCYCYCFYVARLILTLINPEGENVS